MKRRELLNINELFEVLLFEQNINNIRDHFEFWEKQLGYIPDVNRSERLLLVIL